MLYFDWSEAEISTIRPHRALFHAAISAIANQHMRLTADPGVLLLHPEHVIIGPARVGFVYAPGGHLGIAACDKSDHHPRQFGLRAEQSVVQAINHVRGSFNALGSRALQGYAVNGIDPAAIVLTSLFEPRKPGPAPAP